MVGRMDGSSTLRDARGLRALAHPTRLRLLGLLRADGPATGAMLAAVVHEAPGTVSYHLRTLADAGLVMRTEPRSGDRRTQWWEASAALTAWDSAPSDPDAAAAVSALERAVGQAYAERWTTYIDRKASLPREWVEAAFLGDRRLHLTVAELTELSAELEALSDRWQARSDAHGDADGTRAVFFVAQGYVSEP